MKKSNAIPREEEWLFWMKVINMCFYVCKLSDNDDDDQDDY